MIQEVRNTESTTAKPTRRQRTRLKAALAVSFFCLVVGLAWYLTSTQFREHMRRAMVGELERVTGGRVEMASLRWNLSRLEIEADDLTIHGLEPPGETPYAHVDRLHARLKILSFFGREFGLRELSLDHPVVHLIVRPDGTTNQPEPKIKRTSNKSGVEQLFDLAIERAEVRNGWLLFNDSRTALDFAANDLSAQMSHKAAEKRYDAHIRIGKTDLKLESMRPFAIEAETQFSIFRDHAQIDTLRVRSGATRVETRGVISDFAQPHLNLAYNVRLDLAEAGRITRTRELRAGTLEANGSGQFWRQGFNTSGKLTLKNGAYSEPEITLGDLAGGLEYSADTERISVPHFFMRAFGGTARGDAEVLNWRSAATGKRAEQRGRVRFDIQGADFNALIVAISNPRDLPLNTLNAAGSLGGKVSTDWRGSAKNAETELDVEVVPPATPAAGQLPVTARAKAAYQAHTLRIASLELATPASRLSGSGTLGRLNESVHLTASTTDLGEFMPLIDALKPPGPLPVQFNGAANFTGTARGSLAWPTFEGHFEARNFGTLIPRPSTQSSPSSNGEDVNVVWDEVSGDIVYDSTHAAVNHGILRRGNSELRLDANTQLQRGRLSREFPLSVRAQVQRAEVADLQRLFGYSYPVTGKLDASATIDGLRDDLHGQGELKLSSAVICGQAVQSLSSGVRFRGSSAEFSNVALRSDFGEASGEGSYNFDSSAFQFSARGNELKLERVPQLNTAKFNTAGQLTFTASGSGTPNEPVINAAVRLHNLTINRQYFGGIDADAVTHGRQMQVTANSHFQNASVALNGTVDLQADYPAQAELTVSSSNLNPLLAAFLPARMTGPTLLSAQVKVAGPLRSPADLNAEVVVDRLAGELEKISVQNQGPIRLRMAKRAVTVEQLKIGGESNRFLDIRGSAEIAGQHRLALSADGSVNLKLLQTIYPGLMSSGSATLDVAVAGTIQHPAIDGEIKVQNAGFNYIDLPNGLSEVNGSLVFNRNRLQVQKLTARTGGGLVDLGGFITYDRGIAFNLTAKGRDIRIRYPAGVSSTADADLIFAGNIKNATLSGDVTVTRFGLNQEFDFASYLAKGKESPLAPNAESPLNNVHLDVHVLSTPELQVQTSLAKIAGNVDLHLRGTPTHPSILGRVNIVEGELSFNGSKYHLERGDISFANPVRIEPVLNLEATATVREYDITLEFHGPMDKLKTNYRSDPPLPTGDIIALLALGRTRNETENASTLPGAQQQPPTVTESASNALLGQALNATVSSRMQKLFGVSRIKIDPEVGGPGNSANARVTIEQQVSNKVTLTYTSNLSQTAQQIVQFEYNVNRNVSILAVRDQNGIVGVEVRVRQRKK